METSNPITAAEQKMPKPRHRFAKGTSGNAAGRPNIGRRATELFEALSSDFGELSATDAILLRQAALLLARAERVSSIKQADVGLRMSGEARRLIATLRRNAPAVRCAPEPFGQVAAIAQQQEAARRAAELAADASEALDGPEETDGASDCQTPADDETLITGRAKGRRRPSTDGEAA
jgi:hypothetical protein